MTTQSDVKTLKGGATNKRIMLPDLRDLPGKNPPDASAKTGATPRNKTCSSLNSGSALVDVCTTPGVKVSTMEP